ncbi:MAG: efflux RND transporter periplasmic adaptor subunit [Desulfohalobiaceae bacterium]|nr:efflux RND transporter periplasmic adaptor subunit [Desulfohalobiaceae bacterium]
MIPRRGTSLRLSSFAGFVLVLPLALLLAASPARGQEDCIPVELAKVEQEDLPVILNGIGTLEAEEKVMVSSEMSGLVQEVHFRDGQDVDRGELLLSLDSAKLQKRLQAQQAGLREARARMKNARRTYERQQSLYDKGLGSEEARDEALTSYTAAMAKVDRLQAEIEELRESIEDTRIRAPFKGTLGEFRVDPGEFVEPGTPLVALTQKDGLEVSFTIPQRHHSSLSLGQKVSLTVPGYPDSSFPGEVTFLNPVIAESTRSIQVKAEVDNRDGRLRPGGFVSVRLTVDLRENATVIPEEALIPTRKGYMVFVVRDGTAHARDVRIGLRRPGLVEVREGVQTGESVITSGHISVQDGSSVCGSSSNENGAMETRD